MNEATKKAIAEAARIWEQMMSEASVETIAWNGAAWVPKDEYNKQAKYIRELVLDHNDMQQEIDRLRATVDRLVGAIGALSTPDDEIHCIEPGPERDALIEVWLAAREELGMPIRSPSREETGRE